MRRYEGNCLFIRERERERERAALERERERERRSRERERAGETCDSCYRMVVYVEEDSYSPAPASQHEKDSTRPFYTSILTAVFALAVLGAFTFNFIYFHCIFITRLFHNMLLD